LKLAGVARFPVNAQPENRGAGAVSVPSPIEGLRSHDRIWHGRMCSRRFPNVANRGLVLVHRPTGSGKSTTAVRRMLDYLKTTPNTSNVLTIEEPDRIRSPSRKKCLVNASGKVHRDTTFGFAESPALALREDPDINPGWRDARPGNIRLALTALKPTPGIWHPAHPPLRQNHSNPCG